MILLLAKLVIRAAVELAARINAFGLRNAIARERGIAAYRAWLPLERIRPTHIAQEKWEEMFAWPPDNKPPYPSLMHRVARGVVSYLAVILIIAVLLQEFTPFPALTWLGKMARNASMALPSRNDCAPWAWASIGRTASPTGCADQS